MAIKIILTIIFSSATLLTILFLLNRCHAAETKETDISFSGIIEKMEFLSGRDGSDVLIVSGKRIYAYPAWGESRFLKENNIPVGKIFNSSDEEIRTSEMSKNLELYLNKKVEIFCNKKKVGEKHYHYSLIGKKEYYIKILKE